MFHACLAFEPLAAARAEHVVLAPAVDDHHGREAVATGQGHLRVLGDVLKEGASWEEREFGRADRLEGHRALLVWPWDRELDLESLEVARQDLRRPWQADHLVVDGLVRFVVRWDIVGRRGHRDALGALGALGAGCV